MTKRIEITPAPEPLEAYARHFDDLLGKSNQREGFRRYPGRVCSCRANDTSDFPDWSIPSRWWEPSLHGRNNGNGFSRNPPGRSARCKPSGSRGSREDPATAPSTDGVLVIDETGDRKDGHHTAHVGRQYLAKPFARSIMAWSR